MMDPGEGILRCRKCTGPGRGLTVPLCRDSLAAMRHIVYGDPARLYAFRLGDEALKRLDRASEAFLTAQLERNFQTLQFYKEIKTSLQVMQR